MGIKIWILNNERLLYFAGGLLAAVIVPKAVKSKKVRELGVKGLATGMKLQKQAQETFHNMKEEATDMYVDAAQKAAEESDSGKNG